MKHIYIKLLLLAFLSQGLIANAQTTVSTLPDLLTYLDQDGVDVKLAPGTYTVSAADVTAGTFTNPLFLFSGSSSTYDFTGVTINIDTDVLRAFGSVDVYELRITGNDNVLQNLTMVDDGSVDDRPTKRAMSIVMDGRNNKLEGFHMTVRGSYPYGYGDMFGKGATKVITHYKHSALLIRGDQNHVKGCTIIHRSYGHAIFMQAAENVTIEDCYIEGETRTTDDVLTEEGTGSAADNIDFMTVWGYRVPPGFMFCTGEGGIRAYNAGETVIDGVDYSRGTSNVTLLNNTIKYMRTGVTLTHANGTKYVEGCTTIGCERGYAIGDGDIVSCEGDAMYGPLFGVDYDSDKNITADLTLLPNCNESYNGSGLLAYVIGSGHDITIKGGGNDVSPYNTIKIGGTYETLRQYNDSIIEDAEDCSINNYTYNSVFLETSASDNSGISCGDITDNGSDNDFSVGFCDANKANVALDGTATQSTTDYDSPANLGNDGNTDGNWKNGSVTHTEHETSPCWMVELDDTYDISDIIIYNRTSGYEDRLVNFSVEILDADEQVVFYEVYADYPDPTLLISVDGIDGKFVRVAKINTTVGLALAEVEVYATVATSISDEVSVKSVFAYPNPVNDILTVSNPDLLFTQVELVDALGQSVIKTNVNSASQEMDMSHLTAGIYMMRLSGNGSSKTVKIIKQ